MILEVQNLKKVYKKKIAVSDFSITITKPSIVGLLGSNGAGKTTSFYMIAGLIKPDSGNIKFMGQDITNMPIYLRSKMKIGYLPQEPSIFQDMTVAENILSILEIENPGRKNITYRENILNQITKDLHIDHLTSTLGSVLSGGERRRVEVARILANNPKLILLDEPFAGVDPIAIHEVVDLIKKLKNQNISVLITDHNVFETLKIVDIAVIMHEGRTICNGTPQEIINNEEAKKFYLGNDFKI